MNIATTTSRKTWQSLGKHQLLALLAGAAIVLGVAGGVTWRVGGSSDQLVSRTVATSFQSRPFEQNHTFYIVDSEAQRRFAQSSENEAANEREGSGLSGTGLSYSIIQFRTAEDEAAFGGEMNLLTDPTFHVNVVDLRGTAVGSVSISAR